MPRLTPPPNLNPRTPKLALPAGAVDCHVHMFGPRSKYPFGPDAHYISEDAKDLRQSPPAAPAVAQGS